MVANFNLTLRNFPSKIDLCLPLALPSLQVLFFRSGLLNEKAEKELHVSAQDQLVAFVYDQPRVGRSTSSLKNAEQGDRHSEEPKQDPCSAGSLPLQKSLRLFSSVFRK